MKYAVVMIPLCHLFSMLLIKAKKLYYQQKIKSLTKAKESAIILVKVNHTSTQFSITNDEILWFQEYGMHGD